MPFSVYVIELEPDERDEGLPAVYVGCTGLDPEERLRRHKAGTQASRVVKRRRVRLLPELYPRPAGGFDKRTEADGVEIEWAETLRARGYAVYGGH
jgi:predicted GIY-YIG superfamily endonuclease